MSSESVVGLDGCAALDVDNARVAATGPLLLAHDQAAKIATIFDLLSDPNRVRVLFALLEAGELCVCDLAEAVEMSPSALSHALRLLRTTGVVTNRRDGKMVRYRLADSHVRLLLDITHQHVSHDQPGKAGA